RKGGLQMIKELGIIEKVFNHKATVRVQQTPACEHCKSKASCDISKREMMVDLENDLQAKVGDQVELSVPEGAIVKISMFVYLFPIIALMIGAFIGAALGEIFRVNQSISAALTGGIAMGVVFFVLKRFEKTEKFKVKYQTRMTRVIASAVSPHLSDDNI
ncbi:SoxR reducing system RseC family protein, partial [Thermodesulfobacteriota bacterium]